MDTFEIHKYDCMPVLPAAVPAELAFDVLFKLPAPPVRDSFSFGSLWRTWRMDRD